MRDSPTLRLSRILRTQHARTEATRIAQLIAPVIQHELSRTEPGGGEFHDVSGGYEIGVPEPWTHRMGFVMPLPPDSRAHR